MNSLAKYIAIEIGIGAGIGLLFGPVGVIAGGVIGGTIAFLREDPKKYGPVKYIK